ncbi:Hypothetical protein LUCI_1824 [Lucifera butyrica]|uniref:DUF327 domain-containing protein n=1 Tax=Lucifera butyrica TaxID=1351585 RepID=A0A498RBS2_9FIRM|nr:YaaR family protein [Lucifera butyrica]VBB06588.1 Hypothetical protein LUCI_1824 [Lucifera butyrica]
MKVNKMGTSNIPMVSERESTGKPDKVGNHFASELLNSQDKQSVEQLNALLRQIDEQGQKLGSTPTYAELKSYKELVRKFIGEAVGRMYSLESKNGWDSQGRQKMYTIIKQVDQTLADMTEDVRSGQEKQLEILAKHDAIRGMLVDLYT